eukprot:CAMPEP_0197911538 /NCGR_PEP_ID=MMETSP1439-20131203/73008_1 /TAXON_ID=66791 /ORGANISM="Gonyaulax spinifera, Strain CCMP409" /LENGTH=89 /DNA_ID=CAMNT_0043533267 /DNA_START=28 /DNA_END=294 /DNA_ORIENTATION=+
MAVHTLKQVKSEMALPVRVAPGGAPDDSDDTSVSLTGEPSSGFAARLRAKVLTKVKNARARVDAVREASSDAAFSAVERTTAELEALKE